MRRFEVICALVLTMLSIAVVGMRALAAVHRVDDFAAAQRLELSAGDRVEFPADAMVFGSMTVAASGTQAQPIVITTAAGNAVEHAKEAYKFQTGEDYTTPEAAQAWLNENYTPPDQM